MKTLAVLPAPSHSLLPPHIPVQRIKIAGFLCLKFGALLHLPSLLTLHPTLTSPQGRVHGLEVTCPLNFTSQSPGTLKGSPRPISQGWANLSP